MAFVFPPSFRFGTATAATQIEGGCPLTNWADFARVAGRIAGNGSPMTACDSWNRFHQDLAVQKEMGLNAYRLSVEWARIEPEPGVFDNNAIERYRGMLGELVDAGIDPMLTLHHFSIPFWLNAKGGLLSPEFADRLVAFTRHVVPAFSDLVTRWITVNEPSGLAALGHLIGYWPPQLKSITGAIKAHQNLLHAHARMYYAIHALQPDAQVGVAHHLRRVEPQDPKSWGDRAVARLVCETFNDAFANALCSGQMCGIKVKNVQGTQDFFGLNYYGRDAVHFRWHPVFFQRFIPPGVEVTDLDWEVHPEGLLDVVRDWSQRSKLPIYITENGIADAEDKQRPSFLVRHLAVIAQAIAEGIDVRGYYHWSLLDNFEWMFGYDARFGLAHVDYTTQERTLRPSGRIYGEIATQRAISDSLWERHQAPPANARRMGGAGQFWPA